MTRRRRLDISYHNGPILVDPKVFNIYVGSSTTTKKMAILDYFSSHIGNTSQWNVVRQIFDAAGRHPGILTFAGSKLDDSIAPSYVDDPFESGLIQSMMQNYVDSGFITLTDPANTIYAFHFGPGFMYPSDLPYCGWHYYYTIFDHGEPVTVIVVFTLHDNINCRSPFPPVGYYFKFDVNIYQPSPNSDRGLDGIPSTLFHELCEAVSDSRLDAWYDEVQQGDYTSYSENGDLCDWTFGNSPFSYKINGARGQNANVYLQKPKGSSYSYSPYFLIQRMWLYDTPNSMCVQVSNKRVPPNPTLRPTSRPTTLRPTPRPTTLPPSAAVEMSPDDNRAGSIVGIIVGVFALICCTSCLLLRYIRCDFLLKGSKDISQVKTVEQIVMNPIVLNSIQEESVNKVAEAELDRAHFSAKELVNKVPDSVDRVGFKSIPATGVATSPLPVSVPALAPFSAPRPPLLPPGWISLIDHSSGQIFFANTATGVAQWETPVQPVIPVGVPV